MFKHFGSILSLATGMALFAVLPALAEALVDTAWVRRYNGPGNSGDYAEAIAVDDSGNVYVAGESYASGTGIDYATIKYRPNGDTAWVRRYNGFGNERDKADAITVDHLGYVYVTGRSWTSETDWDYATIKYYPNGDTAWVRRYGGSGNDWEGLGTVVAVDDSGNVYVTGYSDGGGGTFDDYATIKYYSNGDTAWVRRYNGPGDSTDVASDITIDDSGNVYVTGYSYGMGSNHDYATIKYDPNGDTAWVRRYDGPGWDDDRAYAIAVDDSGYVYVTGSSYISGGAYMFATIKYYPTGDTVWVRWYCSPGEFVDTPKDIAVDYCGNVYVTGWSEVWTKLSDTDAQYVTIKYSPSGDTAWMRTYDGPGGAGDYANALALDGSSNVYVTGGSVGSGTDWDYVTIKYDSLGHEEWLERYSGSGTSCDEGCAVAVGDFGNVYVTGYTNNDYGTIKYVQNGTDVKGETGSREKPSEFTLFQNHPNPFNQSTKIEFTLAKSGFVILNIYDILGRRVRTLVSEHLSSGYKSVLWDGKNDSGKDVASGIYFYQLRIGDFSQTKKLVLLK